MSDPPFEIALRAVAPGRSHREIVRDLLGNRASKSALKHWRKGRRAPPQWVCDIIQGEARKQAAQIISESELAKPGCGRRAPHIGMGLKRWRANRAKEKARQD